ncbi:MULTISPECIES: tyrosine-type recombinase/integrase [Bacteria]|uniref:tyrosine-type recombinase/integrase n=1 Tax=Bacteria TaxID=2 RepID=UPI002648F162|nr:MULTISPECIES: tyrosine-type recombinase/integrase [Bacteria]
MTTEYLYQQEVDRVLSALMPQNQLIVKVMLQTGMRLSDALQMRTEGLATSGWYTEGKTGKKRRYGLPRPLLEAILEQAGPEWAFPGRKAGIHKTRQAVWRDIKRAAVAFRLPQNVGAHSMRKVYAVRLMQKYGKLEKVQRNLNHASGSVTAIYAMADILLDRKLQARERRRRCRAR